MKLDWWTLLIIVVIAQGVFLLSLLIGSRKRRENYGSIFLFGVVLVFIWYAVEFLMVRNTLDVGIDIFYGTRYGSWLILGPITFFYFKALSVEGWKPSPWQALHLLPFVLFVIVIPLSSGDSLSYRQVHYGMLAVFDYRKKVVTPYEYLYSFLFFIQFVHFSVYLLMNWRVILRYEMGMKLEYADLRQVKWMKGFNLLLMLTLVFVSFFLYLLFATDQYRRHLDYIYVLPIGVFIYFASYYASSAEWKPVAKKDQRYNKSTLPKNTQEQYANQLRDILLQEKPFLQKELKLKELAEMIGVSAHHLSQVINENFGCSFFDLINSYRIEEAKQLISDNPEYTLLQIGFDAGFNNKTSFINAFKKFEKVTPSHFRKALFVE